MSSSTTSAASTDTPKLHARMAAARRNRLRRYAIATWFSMYLATCFFGVLVNWEYTFESAFVGLVGLAIITSLLKPESQHPRDAK